MVSPTATDVSKIRQDMNTLQVKFSKLSSADFRGKSSSKPWKSEVTPPRRRGGSIEAEEVGSLTMYSRMTDLRIVIVMVVKMGIIVREMATVPLGIEDKAKEILEAHSVVKVEDKVNLIEVQILDTQE